MKYIYLFFILIQIGCSRSKYKHVLSNSKYRYSKDIEMVELKVVHGYECEKDGMYEKKIKLKIRHESFSNQKLNKYILRVSWREYMFMGKFGNGEINLKIPFCKKNQIPFCFCFDLIDSKRHYIYVWSSKDPFDLSKENEYNILLKEKGGYVIE